MSFRTVRRHVVGALVVLLAPFSALPPASASEPAGFLPDANILARAPTLSIEEQRYFVYLYARLNKPKVAETIAGHILKANPSDRQTLLVLASMYVEQKDPKAVLRTAQTFLKFYPADHQGLYFLGAGHYLAKEYAIANDVLRSLKQAQFDGRLYPYETDLAASAFAAGDWHRAMLSYQELLRHHKLGDQLRDEVRRTLDDLYRTHLPRLDLTAATVRLERAEAWRYGASHGMHVSDRHWIDIRYGRDDVDIEAAPGLQATRADRQEISVNLSTVYDRRTRTDVWAGAFGDGGLGGARATITFARQREAFLEISLNARSTDSLTLEAIDGRQHSIGLGLNWLVEADLNLAARAQVREVRIEGMRLGRGSSLDLNFDYTIWRQGPRITVGYRGSIGQFSPDAGFDPARTGALADPAGGLLAQQAIASNLVSSRINRQGVSLTITDNLADAWIYRLAAGADYDFALSSAGWNGSLSLTFLPRKSIEITTEAGYTSSATASNAGSSATLFNFYIRAYH